MSIGLVALLDDVARTGRPLVVTKHGRPVARVVPIDSTTDALFGSVTLIADKAEAYYSTGDRWESEES